MNAELIDAYETEGYVNRPLTPLETIKILKDHDINASVTFDGKNNYVTDLDTNETFCFDNWQLFDVLFFLNY